MSKYEKWSVFRASLDPVVGSEQGKSRPVVIISENRIKNLLNTVNVLPITTRKTGRIVYPNEALLPHNTAGLENESIVLCHQIRTIDKVRLTKKYGHIENENIKSEVNDALVFQMGLELS